MKKTSGFTLIEIIVVMVIVGVLAAIALPNLFTWIENSHCSEATQTMGAIADQVDACVAQGNTVDQCFQNLTGAAAGSPLYYLNQFQTPNFTYEAVCSPANPIPNPGYVLEAWRTTNPPESTGSNIQCPAGLGTGTGAQGTVLMCRDPVTSARAFSSNMYLSILGNNIG